MKFGEYLNSNKSPEWDVMYINYGELKEVIKELENQVASHSLDAGLERKSLSVARPTNSAGQQIESVEELSHERFFILLENEMKKIETFTKSKVKEIKSLIQKSEDRINHIGRDNLTSEQFEQLRLNLENAGQQFLKLEKFVNLNFTGFHKILKKHDKRLPNPCKPFYMARLHQQSWVRGDYSDVIVSLSRAFGSLRGDEEAEQKESEKQNFIRSTRKYWVHIEDISHVKYIILQHLPVFLQKSMGGETDSQLINSVYLDNTQMELYHGRLDKTAGAIALRFRWYGNQSPQSVFVERKTHRDAWTGDVSVKERFILPEEDILSLLSGEFDYEAEIEKKRASGKSEADIQEWKCLVEEVMQAINSKQLIPTVRTQYMRSAFQIPFDATVRISLDTNLCMIAERTSDQLYGKRWYRDPSKPVPRNEITRFPHAVLEIKLQLDNPDATPAWVSELLDSGLLMEIHKFSKFIHGTAVLFPDEVRSFPYWIDDPTLRPSIEQSGATAILLNENDPRNAHDNDIHGHNKNAPYVYSHLLPHDEKGHRKIDSANDGLKKSASKELLKTSMDGNQQSLAEGGSGNTNTNMADTEKSPLESILGTSFTRANHVIMTADSPRGAFHKKINTNDDSNSITPSGSNSKNNASPRSKDANAASSNKDKQEKMDTSSTSTAIPRVASKSKEIEMATTNTYQSGSNAVASEEEMNYSSSWNDNECMDTYCEWATPADFNHMTTQKVEPKLFLANERTFIKWLQMAVVMSSISTGILAFSSSTSDSQYFALAILPVSLVFIVYALWTYFWRNQLIRSRDARRWDDPLGPVLLTILLIVAMTVLFIMKIVQFVEQEL